MDCLYSINRLPASYDFTEKCILAELTAANNPSNTQSEARMKWKGSIVEWVELLYSLHEAGVIVIDGRKPTLKQLFTIMGEAFDFEVKEALWTYIIVMATTRHVLYE